MKSKIFTLIRVIITIAIFTLIEFLINQLILFVLSINTNYGFTDKEFLIKYSTLATSVSTFIMIVLLLVFFRRKRIVKKQHILKFNRVNKKAVLYAFLMMVSITAITSIYTYFMEFLSNHFGFIKDSMDFYSNFEDIMANETTLFMTAWIAIFAPILEEFIYRGYSIYKLKKVFSTKATVLISALIFAAAHGNLYQGGFAFFAGLILALVYIKTDSIGLSIILHMYNNLLAVIFTSFNIPDYIQIIYFVISAIALITLPYLYKRFLKYNIPTKNS